MKIIKYLCVAVLVLGLGQNAQAQIEKYTFDQNHTQVIFFVDHMGFAKSDGEFLKKDGYFLFDRGQPEKSSIDVSIPTASLDMDDDKWDEHLKSADFFDVEKYPTMTFKSTAIQVTGEKTANITGDLTIKGVTKPVTMAVTFNKADKAAFNNEYHAGFSAATTIKRSDFGMTNGLPMVGDEVTIMIEVEAVREESAGKSDATNQ